MSLILDRVTYTYPRTTYGLSDISISIATGELIAVIGPSGSGKSTLLKLVSGLTTGHSGSIILDGDDLSHKPVHQRHIGMVFQSYALFPHLDVLGNVAYGLKLRKIGKSEREKTAQELLALVGLEEYCRSPVGRLSGGQQQRVALARALAINPKALLLDEPLAALDASIRGYLRDQIRSIQQRFNATTLLVTHDQEEALSMADRVAVLKDGRLLQLSTPKEIYAAPQSVAVAEFVGLSTIFPARVIAQDCVDIGFARLAAPTGKRAQGQAVFIVIRPEHIAINPPPNAQNRLEGSVTAQRFLGAIYRFDFQVADAPKPFLVEAVSATTKAIAILPENIRVLDQ